MCIKAIRSVAKLTEIEGDAFFLAKLNEGFAHCGPAIVFGFGAELAGHIIAVIDPALRNGRIEFERPEDQLDIDIIDKVNRATNAPEAQPAPRADEVRYHFYGQLGHLFLLCGRAACLDDG